MEAERGEVEQPLRMVGGDGEHSYALNSWHQSKAIINAKTILESAIEDMYKALLPLQSFTVVDLGCSSGPNTLLVVSQVLNIISELHTKFSDKAPLPEIQFFLNDLPRNDFNSVFQSLENFKKKTEEEKGDLLPPYYIAGVPGSFHGRLFPSSTVHFFHSSYSLTWLSQAPSLQGIPPNRGNIYISKTSPPEILKAYREQFQSDFSRFLESRYEELSGEGRMVLTLIGQNHVDDDLLIYTRELLSEALNSMAIEGIISKEKLDAFNLPLYAPLLEEMKSIILSESSFFHLEQCYRTRHHTRREDDCKRHACSG
ncbi:S-adenosyl-L-methionine:benzoic acid/salicylic acid carboxyl methyltransferase 3-like isoform X2 [Curcuma longa]|uniref:S-adenosyl-L-methionine:benzoic acid/salicylic acid carboxyl methyltransferase 3-like isoform X2 n=1 Tax=Curcuma longa TaxID=136217 RepID=UPI003D9F3125